MIQSPIKRAQRAAMGGSARRWSLVLVLMAAFVSGCVTYTDSSLRSKANADRAEAAYVQLGLAYISEGQLGEAGDNLRRALEINPESAPAKAAQGLIFQMQSEEALAEEKFRQALEFDPEFTRGRTYYGAFLYSRGRFQDAYEQFKRASSNTAFGDRGQVYFNLAMCAARLDKHEEAISAFQTALNIQGDNFGTLAELSWLLLYTGDYEKAAHYYKRLNRLVDASPAASHTPRTLLTGLRLARHADDRNREASLALLLRNLYPESSEYRQYKALTKHD